MTTSQPNNATKDPTTGIMTTRVMAAERRFLVINRKAGTAKGQNDHIAN